MGIGPWVRPPDQPVPVAFSGTSGTVWTATTATGGVGPYNNPDGWTWADIIAPAAGVPRGLASVTGVGFQSHAATGRRWRSSDPAPTQGLELRRAVLWLNPTPTYPRIPPGSVPPGGVVEYDDDGQYLADPVATFSALAVAATERVPAGDPVLGQPMSAYLRRAALLDGQSPAEQTPQTMPTLAAASGPILASASTSVGEGAVEFTGQASAPFDGARAFILTTSWETLGVPAPAAPSSPSATDLGRLVQGLVSAVVSEITCLYRPPRYRIITPASGMWRLRQRQSPAGTDTWPLRQRQHGMHSGSWPLRQRQRGV
ncbi:hypothetical protein [Cellulomonas sp.]|uniref:hypothetical protein n=1 Tax=Cellulomonas sp. TaxID=40001 RepID=UPI001B14838A|nr:hypothetical protein [Cellulomonas sp.]MBO9555617.1 hypothetical protein [Cellulomonas sp.]